MEGTHRELLAYENGPLRQGTLREPRTLLDPANQLEHVLPLSFIHGQELVPQAFLWGAFGEPRCFWIQGTGQNGLKGRKDPVHHQQKSVVTLRPIVRREEVVVVRGTPDRAAGPNKLEICVH